MRVSTPSRHPAHTRPRRTSDGVRAGRSSRSSGPAPGVSCLWLVGQMRTGVIMGPIAEVMCCADRLCAYFLRGRAESPAQIIQTRRGQRFRRVSFRPGGGSPLLGRFAAMLSPPWRLCAAFSFSWCNFTRLYFSFVLCPSCGVLCRLRLACVGVWRSPWPSVGRSGGGGACISSRRCYRLRASGDVVGRSGPRHGRRRAGRVQRGPADFFGGCPDRSARASGRVCLPAPKSLGQSRKVESR